MDYILDAIIEKIHECVNIGVVAVGNKPANDGISVFIESSESLSSFKNKGSYEAINVAICTKNQDWRIAASTLGEINGYITKFANYPGGENWQIINIQTIEAAKFIEEENGQYTFGSILKINTIFGGN